MRKFKNWVLATVSAMTIILGCVPVMAEEEVPTESVEETTEADTIDLYPGSGSSDDYDYLVLGSSDNYDVIMNSYDKSDDITAGDDNVMPILIAGTALMLSVAVGLRIKMK